MICRLTISKIGEQKMHEFRINIVDIRARAIIVFTFAMPSSLLKVQPHCWNFEIWLQSNCSLYCNTINSWQQPQLNSESKFVFFSSIFLYSFRLNKEYLSYESWRSMLFIISWHRHVNSKHQAFIYSFWYFLADHIGNLNRRG